MAVGYRRAAANHRQRPAHLDGHARAPHANVEGDGGFPPRARYPHEGDYITYGVGVVVSDYRGVRGVEHSGSTAGYRAELLQFPGKRLAIAVLCNAASGVPTQYASRLVDSLLGSALGSAVATNSLGPRADTTMAIPGGPRHPRGHILQSRRRDDPRGVRLE